MNKEVSKRAWVTPKLEQIAMVDTSTCSNAMNMKMGVADENGMCGSGSAS